MSEESDLVSQGNIIVRTNLMTRAGYSPYCGDMCRVMPRAAWNGSQFVCGCCGWESEFPADFIKIYKAKWNK
jgi:hypothetical protein